jgi:hypothetical protein
MAATLAKDRRPAVPAAVRTQVFGQAAVGAGKYRCAHCGRVFPKDKVEMDHVTPWSKTRTHKAEDMQILCSEGPKSCHKKKTAKEARRRARARRWAAMRLRVTTRALATVAVLGGVGILGALVDPALGRWWLVNVGPVAAVGLLVPAVLYAGAFYRWWIRAARAANSPKVEPTAAVPGVDRILAWLDSRVPGHSTRITLPDPERGPRIEVTYPPEFSAHEGAVRTDMLDKADSMFPDGRWTLTWKGGEDQIILADTPDPLATTIPVRPIADTVDWARGVWLGCFEDGLRDYWVPLLGNHLLVAGATGSGKGSFLWSVIRGVAPAVKNGTCRIIGIDPKGGQELGIGQGMFYRYNDGDLSDLSEAEQKKPMARYELLVAELEQTVRDMTAQARRLKQAGLRELKVPTTVNPAVLVIVDEVADLTAYCPDPALKKRASGALSVLASQGRACGYILVCFAQDPSKNVVTIRGLFPTKIGLRLDAPVEVGMVLGEGARANGARCDKIPRTQQGTGYVKTDEDPIPHRMRAPFSTDDDIIEMVDTYRFTLAA